MGAAPYIELELPHGRTVKVDADAPPEVTAHLWSCVVNSSGGKIYAVRNSGKTEGTAGVEGPGTGKSKRIMLARVVAGAKDGESVEFINGDTLDCRRGNLRIRNRGNDLVARLLKLPCADESSYAGVLWNDAGGEWVAHLGGRYIGGFEREGDAAVAVNFAAKRVINRVAGVSEGKLMVMPMTARLRPKRVRGVRRRSYNCWEAYIQEGGKRRVLGYGSEAEAIALRAAAERSAAGRTA
jgi:hypothetical protein